MNHKQKLGYTLLGAGIMAVGITIGQFITPNIEAQSEGVFEKITCRELYVVDEKGETEIGLGDNTVVIRDKQGRLAVFLASTEGVNVVIVSNNQGQNAVRLSSDDERNQVSVSDNQGKSAILLGNDSLQDTNYILVLDNQGENAIDLINTAGENGVAVNNKKLGKTGVRLYADERENGITVMDKAGNIKWITP
jgi:hypothetical protein